MVNLYRLPDCLLLFISPESKQAHYKLKLNFPFQLAPNLKDVETLSFLD